jgi:hypothetical protein
VELGVVLQGDVDVLRTLPDPSEVEWARTAGGSFEALSSSDSPAVIAGALDGQGQPG